MVLNIGRANIILEFNKRKIVKYIFLIYMVAIIDIVLFKFFGDYRQVVNRVQGIIEQRNEGNWNYELTPFVTIAPAIKRYILGGIVVPALFNFIGNIVIFIPMGFLITFLLKRNSFFKTMGLCLLIIILIEITQFIACLGVGDINDVIINMFGCLIGFFLFKITNLITKRINIRFHQ